MTSWTPVAAPPEGIAEAPGRWSVAAGIHHPRRDASVRTDNYVFAQLIPYIGNKRRLLPLIASGLRHSDAAPGETFVDLFTGSTVVARLAKTMGFRVIANDWEPYSAEIARGTVALNGTPAFRRLGGAEHAFASLNALTGIDGYVATHLCPRDDEHPDPEHERMFFTRANGQRIDAIREQLAQWESEGSITLAERSFALAALVYSVSYVSNTSGLFKGFHRGWGGKTGTALYRILSRLAIRQPPLFDNHLGNLALAADAQTVAAELSSVAGGRPAIVYVDPPYNQHPYGSNYHVLNTVTLWDKPPLMPDIRIDGRIVDKSAIRKDWRTQRRSPYNSTAGAAIAMKELVSKVDARWLMVSYSTDGNIPLLELLSMLHEAGNLSVHHQRYKRYRVSTPRMSSKSHNVEFVAVVQLGAKRSNESTESLAHSILSDEARSTDERSDDGQLSLELR